MGPERKRITKCHNLAGCILVAQRGKPQDNMALCSEDQRGIFLSKINYQELFISLLLGRI